MRGGSAGRASKLERADFEEQYALADDDEQRIAICRRWLTIYRPIPGKAEGFPREGKRHDRKQG
ncbi:MAG: hypothetical protein U0521_28565 [Anaerolineae bacterium]